MLQKLRSRFCVAIAISLFCTSPAWAVKRENRVPLKGTAVYSSASGEAKSLEFRHEIKQQDREELVIELKNVPMKAGTVLTVFIGDEEVGKITLNNKQAGSLKLSTETQKRVPTISPASVVHVKTTDGRLVMK